MTLDQNNAVQLWRKTPEQLARRRASQKKWRQANAEILNFKIRNRYATDSDYRRKRIASALKFKRRVDFREAA